jgi:hypothetical protein
MEGAGMVATKRHINKLRESRRLSIDSKLDAYILDQYGDEQFPYELSDEAVQAYLLRCGGLQRG